MNISIAPIKAYNGEEIKIPMGDGVAPSTEFRHALRWILNNAPFQTQEDCINSVSLSRSIDKAEGKRIVEIEDVPYEWLKKKAEVVTPGIFRVNGNIVYTYICEGFKKEEEVKK